MPKASRVLLPGFLAIAAFAASAQDAPVTPAQKSAGKEITPELLRSHIRFLASDLLEGRGPATRGDQLAEAYIQSQLEGLGLEPGAPGGGWIQKVPLVGIRRTSSEPAIFKSGRGTLSGALGENFVAVSGVQKPESKIDAAEIVFVGYGIVAPEYRWDDYKDADLKGKVLLVMNNDPEESGRAGPLRGEDAALVRALGLQVPHGRARRVPSARSSSTRRLRPATAGRSSRRPGRASSSSCPTTARRASPRRCGRPRTLSKKIVELGGKDLDSLRASAENRSFKPVPLGVTVSVALTNAIGQKESGNVIGVRPGSDPKRAGEAVIYTAHHDHLGIQVGARPGADAIYNGALDNASGVAAILSVAKAFASLPAAPARSTYFAFVAGEEQGLLGSEFLAQHPPVPAGRIAADINIDGIGMVRKNARRRADRPRQVLARRGREGGREDAGPARGGRPVPGSRHFLPLRPVQLREASVCPPRT